MDLDKLNALYLARYGTAMPGLTADANVHGFVVTDFDYHLSLYKLRLSIWRDVSGKEEGSELKLASFDEYEKMLNELEASNNRNVAFYVITSATGSTHLYTDHDHTSIITSWNFSDVQDAQLAVVFLIFCSAKSLTSSRRQPISRSAETINRTIDTTGVHYR